MAHNLFILISNQLQLLLKYPEASIKLFGILFFDLIIEKLLFIC